MSASAAPSAPSAGAAPMTSAELKTDPDEILVSIIEFKEEKELETTVVPAEVIGAAPAEGEEGAADAGKEEK